MPLAQIDIPDGLLGPFALLVGALIVVGVLWRVIQGLVREYVNSLIERAETAERRAEASDARVDRFSVVLEQLIKAVERLEARKP